MQGEKAGACVTDPPYNVGKEFENDKLGKTAFDEFNNLWIDKIPSSCGVLIACHSPQTFISVLDSARLFDWRFGRMLWLWKPGTAFNVVPWHGWARRSECILVFERNAVWPEWVDYHPDMYDHKKREGATEDTVDSEIVLHPTVKPLWVIQDLLNHTVGNNYEPFAGSGTTLVACENLHRKCRAIEISPNYCAVILERMATAFLGIEIERLESTNSTL
jgi:DNA modification methylase